MNTRPLDILVLILILVGGINWGLIGFFQFDLVASIFGGVAAVGSRVVYSLVGIGALYGLTFFNRIRSEV